MRFRRFITKADTQIYNPISVREIIFPIFIYTEYYQTLLFYSIPMRVNVFIILAFLIFWGLNTAYKY